MANQYFIQLAENPKQFEEVDDFVFERRAKCLDEAGNPRYADNFVKVSGKDSSVSIHVENCTPEQLAVMARLAGLTVPNITDMKFPNGFLAKADTIPFVAAHREGEDHIHLYSPALKQSFRPA